MPLPTTAEKNTRHKRSDYHFATQKGLNRKIVLQIAEQKNEPDWMIDIRLAALARFEAMPMPTWGADLSQLDPYDIFYYVKPLAAQQTSWDDIPTTIKTTFDKLGIPQAEQQFLAGVGAQMESEVIYKSLRKKWSDLGVIFCDMTQGLSEHPDLFKEYFGTIVPAHDNKFAALNTAVWSGGSFIYIPKGVEVTMPLQAYFAMSVAQMGQFERTLIIADENSSVHYVEGCSAPVYRKNSLHSAVVELVARPGAKLRYTTIQNWSNNVYNLVTKRALAYKNATVEWIDGNFGSKVTMKYPAIILKEPGAHGHILSIAVAGKGQHQDAGGKMVHCAPNTTSTIVSKSISKDGGRSSYRGLLKVAKGARNVRARVQCDALLLDAASRSDTYPTLAIEQHPVDVGHEASLSKISDEQMFYLASRGLSQAAARTLIINGFINDFVKELPMEYAVEINRLIAHEMEGSIG